MKNSKLLSIFGWPGKGSERRSGYLFIVISLLSLMSTGSVLSQNIQQSGSIEVNIAARQTAMGVTVWAVPAEQKIRPDSRIENSNLIWSKDKKLIKVAGAGNEHVPFQVVISVSGESQGRRGERVPGGFFIKASDLISTGGNKITGDHINFFVEHYIFIDAISSQAGATGYWPDALAPMKVPFSMAAQYGIVENRPIWVDIAIPSGTKPGIYSGTLSFTRNDQTIDTIMLETEVFKFSLPDETPLITYMNITRGGLASFYRKPGKSGEIDSLTQKYYDFLYSHRMEPWFNDMLLPEVKLIDNKVQVTFKDESYRYYMNTLKTKRVLLNSNPGGLRTLSGEQLSDEFSNAVKSYISQVYTYFKKNGWEKKLVFNSPIDEPGSLQDYENTRKWATLVHDGAKNVPFLVTRTPVPPKNNPEWGTFRGYVNNYSMHGNQLNDPDLKQVVKEEKANGGEMTWYISCDQKYPQPNYFIDAPAMDLVMVPWITARYNLDGILYWALNHWNEVVNPWSNVNTFRSGYICSKGFVLNGEGSLLYPGNFTRQFTGQPDVDGPVSSMRFELLREGIEDYVYLNILKNLGDKEFADNQIRELVIDVKTFSRSPEALYSVRKILARRIEDLMK